MKPFTLCVSFLTLCLFLHLYPPLLFSCPFLLRFPLALPFCLCSLFLTPSLHPPFLLSPCASESFTVTFKALCSDCISFLAFYKHGPSENEEEHAGNWVSPSTVPFSFLAPQTSLLCDSSTTNPDLPSPPLGRICFQARFYNQTYS